MCQGAHPGQHTGCRRVGSEPGLGSLGRRRTGGQGVGAVDAPGHLRGLCRRSRARVSGLRPVCAPSRS